MSGIGRVYRQKWRAPDGTIKVSPYFSISFPYQGKNRREATKATSEAAARAILHQRLNEIGRGKFQPGQDKVYLTDLVELLKAHYRNNALRSLNTLLDKLKAPLEFFQGWTVPMITIQKINAFVDYRLDEKKAIATVNGELRALRRLFNIGKEQKVIAEGPVIHLLQGENKREDYIEAGDFYARLERIRDEDVRDLVEFLFVTGWRVSAGCRIERSDIDFEHETVKLREVISKNKKPMLLSFAKFPKMREIFLRRKARLRPACPFVFHRDGTQIHRQGFRRHFKAAFAGTGLTVHGLCRSAAVALSRAKIHETVASGWMNRKTDMYRQYRIISTQDTEEAGEAFQKYLNGEGEKRKVTEIESRKK